MREPISEVEAARVARGFKALGDPVRLRLLSLIASHARGEACVCDVAATFALSGPTISHHLKVLREAGLVTSQRRGTWVYYRARPQGFVEMAALLTPEVGSQDRGDDADDTPDLIDLAVSGL